MNVSIWILTLVISILLLWAFITPMGREPKPLLDFDTRRKPTFRERVNSVARMALLIGASTGFVMLWAVITSVLTGI